MWYTTSIIAIREFWKQPTAEHSAFTSKKLELQAADGDGLSIPPWDNFTQWEQPEWTIKRKWNTLENATEYVNWTNNNVSHCVSTFDDGPPESSPV
jgi:hypothetical protein